MGRPSLRLLCAASDSLATTRICGFSHPCCRGASINEDKVDICDEVMTKSWPWIYTSGTSAIVSGLNDDKRSRTGSQRVPSDCESGKFESNIRLKNWPLLNKTDLSGSMRVSCQDKVGKSQLLSKYHIIIVSIKIARLSLPIIMRI